MAQPEYPELDPEELEEEEIYGKWTSRKNERQNI